MSPGFRLISLNMNYCPTLNFWLFINSTDPLGQLEWLANVLQYSENNGEKVHIIGHINPAGCMDAWSDNYYRIINRYEATVTGQFFGHTHNDEFELFYDLNDNQRPVGIAYLTGSVTPFSFLNPSYRIYTVDGFYANSTWQVLDHDNYIMTLTAANLTGHSPKWTLEYSARKDLNMTSLFASDWNNLIQSLSQSVSSEAANKLYSYFYKNSDATPSCDYVCMKKFLCHFKQARPNPVIPC